MNNGVAKIRMPTRDGRPRVCAPEPKINRATADRNQLFGRYEVRFRADATDGYKLAWRLWPKSGVWPRDGEIDSPKVILSARSVHLCTGRTARLVMIKIPTARLPSSGLAHGSHRVEAE